MQKECPVTCELCHWTKQDASKFSLSFFFFSLYELSGKKFLMRLLLCSEIHFMRLRL